MDNQNILITDFDFQLIVDYFKGLDRQGPGSEEHTRKALSFIPNVQTLELIADIGCGTGAQTDVLLSHTNAKILANDLFPEFLDGLSRRVKANGLNDRIETFNCSMTDLPFKEESLDMIWAEGSIYNIGFEKGFREWRKFLKKDGYIAVTESCWLKNTYPSDIAFIHDHLPEIDHISAKIKTIEQAGYAIIAHFVLPDCCWIENYHAPMKDYMEAFLQKHNNNKTATSFIDRMKYEIQYYKENKEYFGYVFFIARKL